MGIGRWQSTGSCGNVIQISDSSTFHNINFKGIAMMGTPKLAFNFKRMGFFLAFLAFLERNFKRTGFFWQTLRELAILKTNFKRIRQFFHFWLFLKVTSRELAILAFRAFLEINFSRYRVTKRTTMAVSYKFVDLATQYRYHHY